MASIKVKFRPSTSENKEGTIYYQIIQNRIIRQLKTDYRPFMHEWNEVENLIIIGKMVSVQLLLTMYTARHSWASVAKNKNVSISVINEGMGYDTEMIF